MRWRAWLGYAISLIFIYFIIWQPHPLAFMRGQESLIEAFFGSPRFDFAVLWRELTGIRIEYALFSFLLNPFHLLLRSHRWTLMIGPLRRLSTFDSFSLQMIGYFANSALPLRAGEFIRGVLLGRRVNLPISSALAFVFTERVLDVISLLVIIAIVSFMYPFPPLIAHSALGLGLLSIAAAGVIVYFLLAKNPLTGISGGVLNLMPGKIGTKIREIFRRFSEGFVMPKGVVTNSVLLLETVVIWIIYAFQGYLLLKAFGFDAQYPAIGATPILAAFVILIVNSIGLSIPSAPGGVGTFHAACIFALSMFSVPTETAAGYAIVIHGLIMLFYIPLGIAFVSREGLHFNQLQRVEESIIIEPVDRQ